MEEIIGHFYQTNKEIEYDAIRKSMLYIQNFIPTSIWENCITLKTLYISYGLNKITPYWYFTNSYLHACLHIMLLFDHSFVNTSLKRNNHIKLSKLRNDTINNLLYLYCKQNSVQNIQTSFIDNLSNYHYDLSTILKYIETLIQQCNFTMDQRINIMLHSNNNDAMQNHETVLLETIFKAYSTGIQQIGQHMTTQNAGLIDA